jgi:hypothetical protein
MKNITATGNLYNEQITIKQVSKQAAKKAFAQGKTIYLQSSNMRPFGVWQSVYPVILDVDQLQADIKHNKFCIDLYTKNANVESEGWNNELIEEYKIKAEEYKNKIIDAGTQFETVINNYSYYNCDPERGKYVHFYIQS